MAEDRGSVEPQLTGTAPVGGDQAQSNTTSSTPELIRAGNAQMDKPNAGDRESSLGQSPANGGIKLDEVAVVPTPPVQDGVHPSVAKIGDKQTDGEIKATEPVVPGNAQSDPQNLGKDSAAVSAGTEQTDTADHTPRMSWAESGDMHK